MVSFSVTSRRVTPSDSSRALEAREGETGDVEAIVAGMTILFAAPETALTNAPRCLLSRCILI